MNPAGPSWRKDRALDARLVQQAKAVTLDVFDTLLLRRCGGPDALVQCVADQAAASGCFADPAMAEWFPQLRKDAEAVALSRAAASGRHAVTLEEIYAVLPPGLGDRDALCRAEWAAECANAVANPFLADLLHHCAQQDVPVLLLSDMHLGAARIEQLLDDAGIPRSCYRDLLVSSDFGRSKSEGGLFRVALDRLTGLRPDEVLHIGDNPHADVAMARQAGLTALHYELAEPCKTILELEGLLGAGGGGSLALRRTVAGHHAAPEDPEAAFWFDAGLLVLGPAIDAFARWVLAECRSRGITRIAPILREGAIFARVMAHHAALAGTPFDIRPVHLSRQALYRASVARFDRAHVERFAQSSVYRTVDSLLALHGCAELPEALEPYRHRPLVELIGRRGTAGPDVFGAVVDILLRPEVVQRVERDAAEQRALLRDYLDRQFGDRQPVALVDFGAQGTMNHMLETTEGLAGRWPLHHYLLYGTRNLAQKMLAGMDVRIFAPAREAGFAISHAIQRTPQFLELLLNGNAGTTLGFTRTPDGRAAPVTAMPVTDQQQCARLDHVHAGIMACVEAGSRADPWRPDRPDEPESRGQALGILHRAIHLPTAEEAQRLGDLIYDYSGEGEPRRIVEAAATAAIAQLPEVGDGYRLKMALQLHRAAVQWPQGVLTRADPLAVRSIHEGAMPGTAHSLICRLIIARLLKAGERSVVVCAAGGEGGMGPTFIDMARAAGLDPVAYLDYFPDRVGRAFRGVPVVAASDLAGLDCSAVAIVSTGYGDALEARIGQAAPAAGSPRRCYRISAAG